MLKFGILLLLVFSLSFSSSAAVFSAPEGYENSLYNKNKFGIYDPETINLITLTADDLLLLYESIPFPSVYDIHKGDTKGMIDKDYIILGALQRFGIEQATKDTTD